MDVINTGVYLARGKYGMAIMSGAAIVPVVGSAWMANRALAKGAAKNLDEAIAGISKRQKSGWFQHLFRG